jgi:hypothetical protein
MHLPTSCCLQHKTMCPSGFQRTSKGRNEGRKRMIMPAKYSSSMNHSEMEAMRTGLMEEKAECEIWRVWEVGEEEVGESDDEE